MVSLPVLSYPDLKRRLWRYQIVTAFVMGGFFLWYQAALLPWLVGGVVLGSFFLGSLMFSAEYPRNHVQFVFSLFRMVLLAYLIVCIGNFKFLETAVVICGFLSYKVGIVIETVIHALPALRFRKANSSRT